MMQHITRPVVNKNLFTISVRGPLCSQQGAMRAWWQGEKSRQEKQFIQ